MVLVLLCMETMSNNNHAIRGHHSHDFPALFLRCDHDAIAPSMLGLIQGLICLADQRLDRLGPVPFRQNKGHRVMHDIGLWLLITSIATDFPLKYT